MTTRENNDASLMAHLMRRARTTDPGETGTLTEAAGNPQDGHLRVSTTPEGYTLVEVIPPQDHFQTLESPWGAYISTPGCRSLPLAEVHEAPRRFYQQDWGNVYREDQEWGDHNRRTREGPVLAAYGGRGPIGKIWVHLGRHAPHPTAILPGEY